MTGMNHLTGSSIEGAAHIAQSITDILTTPIGTRVMRRDYGSRLPELIDAPVNRATRQLMAAASAGAIARWEPRIRVTRFAFATGGADGTVQLTVEGQRTDLPSPTPIQLSIQL